MSFQVVDSQGLVERQVVVSLVGRPYRPRIRDREVVADGIVGTVAEKERVVTWWAVKVEKEFDWMLVGRGEDWDGKKMDRFVSGEDGFCILLHQIHH